MATWKKVLVSGSSAALTTVTADTSVSVGGNSTTANNVVGTDVTNTRLSGSFSGSFYGDGSGLRGVIAAFPTSQATSLLGTDQFYVNTGSSGYITLDNVIDVLVNSNTEAAAAGNLTKNGTQIALAAAVNNLTSIESVIYNIPAGQPANYIGFVGTSSFANSASFALTASYALNAGGGTLAISGSNNASDNITLGSDTLHIFGTANEIDTAVSNNTVTIGLPDNVTVTGDLAVNGGDITTTAASATVFNTNATAITVGGNTTTTTMQNLTLNGNLNVLGTTTTVTTQNLTVADRFILLGSSSLNSNIDGGIVVQNAYAVNNGKATGSGYALFMDGANLTAAGAPRWAVTSSLSELADEATPDEYMVTAKKASGAPTAAPTYGSASLGYGNIYVNSSDESIWIYV